MTTDARQMELFDNAIHLEPETGRLIVVMNWKKERVPLAVLVDGKLSEFRLVPHPDNAAFYRVQYGTLEPTLTDEYFSIRSATAFIMRIVGTMHAVSQALQPQTIDRRV